MAGRAQEQAQRHLAGIGDAFALQVRVQHFLQLLLRQRFAGQRVQDHLARRDGHAQQEMIGERHALERQADLLAQFHEQHRQRDRDAAPLAHHHVQVRVVRIVVVVGVRAKAEVAIEEMIQQAQPLDGRRAFGDPPLQAQRQHVEGGQFGLQVQVRIGILRDG
ncbi:hypothetical protein FQZ97_956420 [compost metagenome]